MKTEYECAHLGTGNHYVDNKWFIYFAGGDIEDIWAIRPYVLMCEGDDPLKGPGGKRWEC